jgi:hypothetical protein
MAGTLVQYPEQVAMPDSLRLPAFRSNRIQRLRGQVTAEMNLDLELEGLNLVSQLQAARA